MFRIVPRHNINLDRQELLSILSHLGSDSLAEGKEVRRFEDRLSDYHNARHAIVLSSARSALFTILTSMELPTGSEVIVPAYSFFTIPEVVKSLGLKPVYARCDPLNYAIDPNTLADSISKNTAAIIVEHPFGQPAPIKDILTIAEQYGLPVIEDPSQSIGTELCGQKVGTFGIASCMSLVHGKNLMTFGGGVILTNDSQIYAKSLRLATKAQAANSGKIRDTALKGIMQWALSTKAGFSTLPFVPFYLLNIFSRKRLDQLFEEDHLPFDSKAYTRLSNLQSALGNMQLLRLDERNKKRRENAEQIIKGLQNLKGIALPHVIKGAKPTYNALPIRVKNGSEMQRKLLIYGVDTRADYMTIFADQQEWHASGDVIYLPNHPQMNAGDIKHVIRTVRKVIS